MLISPHCIPNSYIHHSVSIPIATIKVKSPENNFRFTIVFDLEVPLPQMISPKKKKCMI